MVVPFRETLPITTTPELRIRGQLCAKLPSWIHYEIAVFFHNSLLAT